MLAYPRDAKTMKKFLHFEVITSSSQVGNPVLGLGLQTNDRPNIQTYALCTFTFSLQTFTIFSE